MPIGVFLLLKFLIMRKGITPTLRFQVLNRDNFTCQYCGLKANDGVQLQVDHKISVKNGGTNSIENLITSCFQCNIGKGKNNLEEVKHKLYETKISDCIKNHLTIFYKWWNNNRLGNIDNNTKSLLNIYFGYELGGDNYYKWLDIPGLPEKYLGKSFKELENSDYKKLGELFKEGGEYCNDVLDYMEGPFGTYIDMNIEEQELESVYSISRLLDDDVWNKNGICYKSYNNRLNYILTEKLLDIYKDGGLKNNYSIKKFSYFFNEIQNG